MSSIKDIEKLLNFEDAQIRGLYNSWDKGDCSLIGLIEILLVQEIENHKKLMSIYYDEDFDHIKLRYTL